MFVNRQCVISICRYFSSAVEKITERLSNTGPATEVFQREYVSGVVSEAMQEWCDGVEKRLWGLQYSLTRQMQQHQVRQ